MPHQSGYGAPSDPASGLAQGVVEGLTPSGIGGIFEKLDPQTIMQMLMGLFGGGAPQSPFAKGGAPTDPGGSAFQPNLRDRMTGGQ